MYRCTCETTSRTERTPPDLCLEINEAVAYIFSARASVRYMTVFRPRLSSGLERGRARETAGFHRTGISTLREIRRSIIFVTPRIAVGNEG